MENLCILTRCASLWFAEKDPAYPQNSCPRVRTLVVMVHKEEVSGHALDVWVVADLGGVSEVGVNGATDETAHAAELLFAQVW